MKHSLLLCLLALACMACSKTQQNAEIIRITDEDIFSQCFVDCDTDGDGIVTSAEAENAKLLVLDRLLVRTYANITIYHNTNV